MASGAYGAVPFCVVQLPDFEMKYNPQIDDLSGVVLSPDILELTERLAERSHDVWAAGRIREGWRYGSERNDELKCHPCLVPYAELPDSEKEYDRQTALETLRYVVACGYDIKPARKD